MKTTDMWNILTWATFMLGISELVSVVGGFWFAILAMMITGLLFILFVKRVEFKVSAWTYIISAWTAYLVLGIPYEWMTQLELSAVFIKQNGIIGVGFLVGAITSTTFVKARNVVP